MDQLNAMRAYRRVVELGSFSAAARQAGVCHTVLSRQVKHLEREWGVQLLLRTTRQVQPTEAGELFYRHCGLVLAQLQTLHETMANQREQPTGNLRLSMGTAYGELELHRWLPGFIAAYPHLQVQLDCSDRFVDLLQDGVDVSLRVTDALPDSSLVARRLAHSPVVLVATPDYLQRLGTPVLPEQLQAHQVLSYNGVTHPQRLHLTGPEGLSHTLDLPTRLCANSPMALRAATLNGLGIAHFDRFIVQDALSQRRLVEVLPDWHLPGRHLYALYPQTRHPVPKVRALLDHLQLFYADAGLGLDTVQNHHRSCAAGLL